MLSKYIVGDRYQIKKQLSNKVGRGTYLACDLYQKKQVIIKIINFNQLFSWYDFKIFEREAEILKNINHPNIPQYLDYFEVEVRRGNLAKYDRFVEIDREYFQGFASIQTYITAPSLKELIQQGIKFSETEIIQLAQKLLDLLNYLHRLNPPVIHRNLKPSNILLTNRSGNSIGDVYLVDFGSVQTIAKKEPGTITIGGTYDYIPLEQFMGQTSFASDLYSLGMTLIYLITGLHPADLTKTSGKVKFDRSNISSSFARWLTKITEPYIEQRYQSATLAKTALVVNVISTRVISTNFLFANPVNFLSANTIPFEAKSIIEMCYFLPRFKFKTSINSQHKSQYHNLKAVRDRDGLDILYHRSRDRVKFYSYVFTSIIIMLFFSGIGGAVLMSLLLFGSYFRINFILLLFTLVLAIFLIIA